MKYILDISEIVYRDILGIQNCIALDKPSAARKVVSKIIKTIESLEESPLGGFELRKKFNLDTDLCGKLINPYIVIFKIEENTIKIFRILDARSNYLFKLGLLEIDDLN